MMAKLPSQVDLSKGGVPILLALALAALLMSGAYGIGNFVGELISDKEQAEVKFKKIDADLTKIRELMESGSFVRRADFELWCRNAEILNRGFKCGNIK